ncbi:hypothetical protein ACU60U_19800 [Klebsiella aerogenes]
METRQSFSDVLVPGVVELALASGRTSGAVRLIASKLDCQNRTSPRWTTEEDDITRKHYAKGAGFAFIMALLKGRTAPAISARSDVLGVASGRFWREEEIQIPEEHYSVLEAVWLICFPAEQLDRSELLPGGWASKIEKQY